MGMWEWGGRGGQTEKEWLRELLLMTAVSIVVGRSVTVGGLTDAIYFCANLYSEGPTQTLFVSSPSLQLRGSFLNFPDSLAFLVFHPDSSYIHLNYSFIHSYYSERMEACVKSERRWRGVEGSCWWEREGAFLLYSKDKGCAAICSAALWPGRIAACDTATSVWWGDILCLLGMCSYMRMFGIAGGEASDAFLEVTEHPSHYPVLLGWEGECISNI